MHRASATTAPGAHKLGPGGDFTTAPEVSRLFGGCVARQCAEILSALGRGSILEIGAGSGRLAADILSRLEALGLSARALPRARDQRGSARAAAPLHSRTAVPHLARRVEWLDAPPDVAFDGVVLANEVLDALPVTRFRWHSGRRAARRWASRARACGSRGCRGQGAMPSPRNALAWRKRAAAGRRATPRSIASGSARGPPRSRSRIARASRCGSITACRGATTISRSGATAP